MDLVLAAVTRRAVGHFFHGVGAADQFDDLGFLVAAVFIAVFAAIVAFGAGMDAVALFVGVRRGVRNFRCLGFA